MSVEELKEKTKESCFDHPEFAEDLMDLYSLALDEIDQGGSTWHECELALSDMEYLINTKEL